MQDFVWLAADYHFPSTYSCRMPMSSMNSTQAMPAPSPATIRLALVRVGIEVFGIEDTRDTLFPVIRSAAVRIRPPEKVAFSSHLIAIVKATNDMTGETRYEKTVGYREMAHATGPMTIYIQIPLLLAAKFTTLLQSIGYWGQGSSMTYCMRIDHASPQTGTFAIPFATMEPFYCVREQFSCLVSEFRDGQVEWEEILPSRRIKETAAVRLDLYVWPLQISEQCRSGKLLLYRALCE